MAATGNAKMCSKIRKLGYQLKMGQFEVKPFVLSKLSPLIGVRRYQETVAV